MQDGATASDSLYFGRLFLRCNIESAGVARYSFLFI